MNKLTRFAGVLALVTAVAGACSKADTHRPPMTPSTSRSVPAQAPARAGGDASVTTRPATDAAAATRRAVLPPPDGPYAVGAAATPLPGSIVFYPAAAGTGVGSHPYLDPATAAGLGVPSDLVSGLTTSARTGAAPLPAKTARPVVVIAPGFGSLIALSTSLAEHLASHGYVVLAVQSDVRAESASMGPKREDARARSAQVAAALDMIGTRAFTAIAGPVDTTRVAVGGHSYAGSVAFNTSLHDSRVAAVFDLDGRLFDGAANIPVPVPALVVTSSASGTAEGIRDVVRRSTKTVAVGLLRSDHFDLTDAPAIANVLRAAGASVAVGSIGKIATSDTAIIVRRFLDAALHGARVPTAAALVSGLPSTTSNPFHTAR